MSGSESGIFMMAALRDFALAVSDHDRVESSGQLQSVRQPGHRRKDFPFPKVILEMNEYRPSVAPPEWSSHGAPREERFYRALFPAVASRR